ncbi:MAG TPA: Ig-like domain-containing protein, partial [Leptospiraceae bacterium]|nr:Ig-like domain-containing protein [Leptospiraceae bacterium]
MKKNILILFPILTSLYCLEAKKSPFDATKNVNSLLSWVAVLSGFGNNSTTSSLNVVSTSPADNDTGVTANAQIAITFNTTMDKTTITTNTDNTTCSGTVQISFDNFATCIRMRSSITTTDNKTFILNANPTMGTYATHKIRVTTGATSQTKEKLSADYSHTNGFTTATPCTVYNAQTCPIPFSTIPTLSFSLGNGGLVIPIESGTAKGKILVLQGGGTSNTNIYDPDLGIFITGPNLPSVIANQDSGTAFSINSGTNVGKVLIVHSVSNISSIYDPVSNTMQVGPNLTSSLAWSNNFLVNSGINSGKTVILSQTVTTNIYDPISNTFSVGNNLNTALSNNGSNLTVINSGSNSGKAFIVSANNLNTSDIYGLTVDGQYGIGPTFSANPFYGSHSFLIPSGIQSGNILIARGNSSTDTFILNSTSLTLSTGPTLPNFIDTLADRGTHSILISSGINQGNIWLLHAGNNTSPTSFYNPATNTFSTGPTMPGLIRLNSKTVYLETGIHAGKYLTIYGSNVKFTSLYDPIKNALDASSILPSAAGVGVNRIPITTGTNAGKMLVINGGNNTSSLFDFASGTFTAGPNLTGVMGRSPGLFTIYGGTQDGKTLVVHGGGLTTTSLYDPIANTFSAGPALSTAAHNITNECIFKVPSGAQAGKYLIIHGNVSQNTSLYDPSTNTFAAGPTTGGIIGLGATCFPINSGANAGKFLVIQGFNSTPTRVYDPSTNSFAAGPNLTIATTAGTFSMPITNGSNNGKALVIIGTGNTTNLYDPTTHTFSVGPNLSGSASSIAPSSYLLLSNGANKDKYWIMHGTTSSIYDPNTNAISSGPAIP